MGYLRKLTTANITAATREVTKQQSLDARVRWVEFDFGKFNTFDPLLSDADAVFLLRPPQIADVATSIRPFVERMIHHRVKHVVFLSVEGAGQNKFIPHHKIEALLKEAAIPYTFLRPAYFMQNFNTTLHSDLVERKQIFVPAGNAKFTIVDVRDVGEVAARVMVDPAGHVNQAYELMASEVLTFREMAEQLSNALGSRITYKSPNLFQFFFSSRKKGINVGQILVMMMLHYIQRFKATPVASEWMKHFLARQPRTFMQYAKDYRPVLVR